ncbi:MAG: hypothetical protein ABI678_15465 [Kofleriaceae bacterium]
MPAAAMTIAAHLIAAMVILGGCYVDDLDEESSALTAPRLALVAMTPAAAAQLPAAAASKTRAAMLAATLGDFDGDQHPDVLTWTSDTVTIRFATGRIYTAHPPLPTMIITKVVPVTHGADNRVSFLASVYRYTDWYARSPQWMLLSDGAGGFTSRTLDLEITGRDVTCTKLPIRWTSSLCMFASYGNHERTYSTLVEVGPGGNVTDVTEDKGLPWRGASGTPVGGGNNVNGKFMMGFNFVDLDGDGLPDLVGSGQHSQMMYALMIRDGQSYRFGPTTWFDERDDYLGVSTLGKNFYKFPCVYAQLEDGENHEPTGDFITCYQAGSHSWIRQPLPMVTTTGEQIETYLRGSVEAKIVDSSDAIYIATRARLTDGTVTNLILRATAAPGTPALVPPYMRSEVFEPTYYRATYPDLDAAFGASSERLIWHWVHDGMTAGRRGSAQFWSKAYGQRYPDLDAVFGTDYPALIDHYIVHGIAEGRSGI